MDYKILAERIKCPNIQKCPFEKNKVSCTQCQYKICDEAVTAITDLLVRAEAAEARAEKAERERDAYKIFFDDVSSKPDCNTCCLKQCEYRPEIGQTTRFNCPLWRGKNEE